MNFNIEWIENNAIVSMTGDVGFKDIDLVNGLLYGDARFEKMEYQIFDLANVDGFTLHARDFEMLGALDRNSSVWNANMKVAVVFKDEEMIRLMDYYKNVMKDTEWKIEVFRELANAKKWCMSKMIYKTD